MPHALLLIHRQKQAWVIRVLEEANATLNMESLEDHSKQYYINDRDTYMYELMFL